MKHSLKIPLKVDRARSKSGPRLTKLSAGIAAGRVRFVVFPLETCAAESNVEREFAISKEIGPRPRKLAELSHPRIQASRAEIAKRLEGNWRQELIFVLQQEIEMYDIYQRRVAECDQELQKHLRAFVDN
jgi:hypothetical protein